MLYFETNERPSLCRLTSEHTYRRGHREKLQLVRDCCEAAMLANLDERGAPLCCAGWCYIAIRSVRREVLNVKGSGGGVARPAVHLSRPTHNDLRYGRKQKGHLTE
jgi:hypothetical protein